MLSLSVRGVDKTCINQSPFHLHICIDILHLLKVIIFPSLFPEPSVHTSLSPFPALSAVEP